MEEAIQSVIRFVKLYFSDQYRKKFETHLFVCICAF